MICVHVCGTCRRCAVIRLYMLYIHYIPGIAHRSGGNLELYSHSYSYSYSDTRIAIHWVLRSCAWLHVATAHGCGHGMGIDTVDVLTERANAVQTDPKSTWLNLTKPKSSQVGSKTCRHVRIAKGAFHFGQHACLLRTQVPHYVPLWWSVYANLAKEWNFYNEYRRIYS